MNSGVFRQQPYDINLSNGKSRHCSPIFPPFLLSHGYLLLLSLLAKFKYSILIGCLFSTNYETTSWSILFPLMVSVLFDSGNSSQFPSSNLLSINRNFPICNRKRALTTTYRHFANQPTNYNNLHGYHHRSASPNHHHPHHRKDSNMSTLKMIIRMSSNPKFSAGNTPSTAPLPQPLPLDLLKPPPPTPQLMIPADLTYFSPQNKIATEKRSPVNKNVQQINNEEEASVLSRYPFHGNRALPSRNSPIRVGNNLLLQCPVAVGHSQQQQRWSVIDFNNNNTQMMNRGEEEETAHSELDVMLGEKKQEQEKGRPIINSATQQVVKPTRQLSSARSHSSNNKIYYKSPPMRRYSNVYDYTYMSDPSLNAIFEDSDSQ